MNDVAILIPAYKPEETLFALISGIQRIKNDIKIILVQDGVFPEHENLIERILRLPGVFLVRHSVNLGKGRALKTGFNEILVNHPEIKCVVTADADGQHLPEDILNVARCVGYENRIWLGSRFVTLKNIPIKSKIGNTLTRFIFKILIGLDLKDTQTGLRGIPSNLLALMMTISGEKYEYETNMLIRAKQERIGIAEVDIETVYINQNRGSHFNPILDSMRIYFLIFRFFFSSIATSMIDLMVFSSLVAVGARLEFSILASRLVAGTFNFTMNKRVVFKNLSAGPEAALKYWLLVLFMAGLSYLGTVAFSSGGMNVYLSKVLMEALLFLFSFSVQRDVIFDKKDSHESD